MDDVFLNFLIAESRIVVMDRDALFKCLIYRFAQDVVEMRFSTEDQCKAVDGIVSIVHEHLDIIQDSCGKILCFIYSQEQRLSFLMIEVIDLFLNGLEHSRLSTSAADSEYIAELFVEFCDADSGKAHVFHVIKVRIE